MAEYMFSCYVAFCTGGGEGNPRLEDVSQDLRFEGGVGGGGKGGEGWVGGRGDLAFQSASATNTTTTSQAQDQKWSQI